MASSRRLTPVRVGVIDLAQQRRWVNLSWPSRACWSRVTAFEGSPVVLLWLPRPHTLSSLQPYTALLSRDGVVSCWSVASVDHVLELLPVHVDPKEASQPQIVQLLR